MPSSPQTVTTRGVFDYLYNSAGKAIVGATVNCTLNFNGSSVTSPIVNLGELQQATVTDQNGFWRFNLVPNDTITPSGTLYSINAGNIASYDISVPSGVADIQSSSILANTPSVLSPAATGLTGPITVTGNETVTGNLSVSGTTTLASTTTGALTTGAQTVGGDLTISSAFRLLFGAAAAKIIPGATSISHRNNADNADNLLISDAGVVTTRNDIVISVGRLLVSAAAAKILGGATSLSLRNNADSADNVLITDAGNVTVRGTVTASTNPFKCRAYATTGTAVTNGVAAKIALQVKDFDPNNNFDNVTNFRYTAPVAGYYLLSGRVAFQNGSNISAVAQIRKNGTEVTRAATAANTGQFPDIWATTIINLAANDFIELWAVYGATVTLPATFPGDTSELVVHYMSS